MNKRFQSYFTKDKYIKKYMVDQLHICDHDKVLEPAGGNGEFIDALLNKNRNINIDTFDIDALCIRILYHKYNNKLNVHIKYSNTLFDPKLDKIIAEGGKYDKVISNPPYGALLTFKERHKLKRTFGKLYANETYLLFLVRSIHLLRNNGILSFIIPDTFLYLRTYHYIRVFLLEHTKILNILIFPSSYFYGVNFQYSNLSIITLQKCRNISVCLSNIINIYKNFKSSKEFLNISNNNHIINICVKQNNVLHNINSSFILDKITNNLIQTTKVSLGDIASCVTGIYTGNNKKYIALVNSYNNGSNSKYKRIPINKIDFNCCDLRGISDNGKEYVPIAKGSSKDRYKRHLKWVIRWTPTDIKFFNKNKRSRFQNSKYYFKHGIAVPMVKSRVLKATEINNVVFDQSIVCIFPKERKYFNYLLGLLNTNLINRVIHYINPTVNNSANYLKHIPIKFPSSTQFNQINIIVNKLKRYPTNTNYQWKLNRIIDSIYLTI